MRIITREGAHSLFGARFETAMSAGRIYWGQIATVLSLMALGMIIATQWTAERLGFQSALGDPNWVLFHYPIYAPWRFFIWWFQYDHYARTVFETGAAIVLFFAFAAIFSAFGFSRWRAAELVTSLS